MADPPGRKQSFCSRLFFSLKDLIPCLTKTQLPSPQPEAPPPAHPVTATPHPSSSTIPATMQQLGSITPQDSSNVAIGGLPDTVPVANTGDQRAKSVASTNTVYEDVKTTLKPQVPPVLPSMLPASAATPHSSSSTISTTQQLSSATPQNNPYVAIGGLSDTAPVAKTRTQHAKEVASTVYEGVKTTLKMLEDCSDMFPPLKTAVAAIGSIIEIFETVSNNKEDLENIKLKLNTILSIIEKYKKYDGVHALRDRIQMFCTAITLQSKLVDEMRNQSTWTGVAKGAKDAETISGIFRSISHLCDVFQMDTQLNIEGLVGAIFERQRLAIADRLYHEGTSYKTRTSAYGDASSGCMEGTRVSVLKELEAWALDPTTSNVYWMVGMAGVGKTSIAHTFCQILEEMNILGGNFFASRASTKTDNAYLIIPAIAYSLARASPRTKIEVIKAIEDDDTLAEPTFRNTREQFTKLVYNPSTRANTGVSSLPEKPYKVIVIDALDECSDLDVVSLLVKIVLEMESTLPLKVFISSRDETPISNAFALGNSKAPNFHLHNIERNVVQGDIRMYLRHALASIKNEDPERTLDEWPSPTELKGLIAHSGTLFIYAATAVRYIRAGLKLGSGYKARLTEMATRGLESVNGGDPKANLDALYLHILGKATTGMQPEEIGLIRNLLTLVIFLRIPLTIYAIESLSGVKDAKGKLMPLSSVIQIRNQENSVVSPFHASFPDFITNHNRCSTERSPSFPSLVAFEGHEFLALKCLRQLNKSLKYNICGVSDELTHSRRDRTNAQYDVGQISEALRYSCIYWAVHLVEIKVLNSILVEELNTFLHTHLLHWIECLSLVRELQAGLKSLSGIIPLLSTFKHHDLQMLIDDARRCLQMNFEAVQNHCMEVYQSALVWLPRKSIIRATYNEEVGKVPKLVVGLPETWGSSEHVIQNGSSVNSVAFSQDGSRVVSGSDDTTVRIWNATTGEMEAELKGHTNWVYSVAFSQDGSWVVSGSDDKTVRIWNAMTGEMEAELKGHTGIVRSVAFSQDGSRVVSGSNDKTVRIWNATIGKVEAELKGHTNMVNSVAFSPNGSRVVSGSSDNTVRIWNATTGEVEAELKGHIDWVSSVAFSQDGSRVVSGSYDTTVHIWNATTGDVEAELKGHTNWVRSVAFSPNGSRVVSGSDDTTVRIWNATTGEMEAELKGHTNWVYSVAFSQDGSQVVSGSDDKTVRIWNAMTGEVEAELKGHTNMVNSVAFSQDGSRVVSGSEDKTVRIWNAMTGDMEAELKGHTNWVKSVAFSQDGSRVVSGSNDKTVRIWNATTGEMEAELKGHTYRVNSVAFSQDGSRVVSGSSDWTVRIWDVSTGNFQLVANSESVILPDGGTVTYAGEGDFYLTYLVQQHNLGTNSIICISDDNQWIVGTHFDCWIPSHYRDIQCHSICGSRVCLGCGSGRVVILDMNVQ